MMSKLSLLITILLLFACGDDTEPRTFFEPPVIDITDWTIDSNQFENIMTIVAQVHLDGDQVCGMENKIVAFCGDEIRGVAEPYHHLDCAVYNLIIYSNGLDEIITFGVYLSDEDQTVICKNEITFEAGEGLGEPDSPDILNIK